MGENELSQFYAMFQCKTFSNKKCKLLIIRAIKRNPFCFKRLFNDYKYIKDVKVKEESSKMMIGVFADIINNCAEEPELIKFLIKIISKMYQEQIVSKDFIITLAKFFDMCHQIDFIMSLYIKTLINDLFALYVNESSYEDLAKIKNYINNQENKYKIISLLTYGNPEIIPKIFLWDFDINFFFLAHKKYASSIPNEKIFLTIKNNVSSLKKIINEENLTYSKDKNIIMNGILVQNGFSLNNPISFPANEYSLTFSFSINSTDKISKIISFVSEGGELIGFYVKSNLLKISLDDTEEEIAKIVIGEYYTVNFHHIKGGIFKNDRVEIFVNGAEKNFDLNKSYPSSECTLVIGKFRGEIGEVILDNVSKEDSSIPLLKISPLIMYNNYLLNRKSKKWNVISSEKDLFKISTDNPSPYFDIPFERKFTINEFNRLGGYEYLIVLMDILHRRICKENVNEVFSIVQEIVKFVFECGVKTENVKKVSALFFSMSLLVEKSMKEYNAKMPSELLNVLCESVQKPGLSTRLINKIIMICINVNSVEYTSQVILNLESIIPKISKEIEQNKKVIEYFLNNLVILYKSLYKTSDGKPILRMLGKLIEISKSGIIINYLLYLQKEFMEKKISNVIFYKLLKSIYLSVEKQNISSSTEILNNFFTILSYDVKELKFFKPLIIRFIDDCFIKKYSKNINIKITYQDEQDTSNETTAKKCIDEIISSNCITSHETLISFLLCAFSNTPRKNIRFYKSNEAMKEFNFENVITANDEISTVFSIIKYPFIEAFPELVESYSIFVKSFIEAISNNIQTSMKSNSLFKNTKVFGDILYNIINYNPSIYSIKEICSLISNTLFLHSYPFYFKLISERLAMENEINEVVYKYTTSMLDEICNKLKSKKNLINKYYRLNWKNYVLLVSKIIGKCDKKLSNYVSEQFFRFISENTGNAILFTKTNFGSKSLLEIIIDILLESENNSELPRLLKELLYLNFYSKKKNKNITHTIFYYFDIDSRTSTIFNEAERIDREFTNEGGTENTSLFTIIFLNKFVTATMTLQTNKEIKNFLLQVIEVLIGEINKYYLKKMVIMPFQGKNKNYNDFKRRIENHLKEGRKVTYEFCCKNLPLLSIPQPPELPTNPSSNPSTISSSTSTSKTKREKEEPSKEVPGFSIEENGKHEQNFFYNNIDDWYIDTKDVIFSVLKPKNYLYKNVFSTMNIDEYYEDENFGIVVKGYQSYNKNAEKVYHLKYPSRIKNYLTDEYTKPFLKLDRGFYSSRCINISHNYLKGKLGNLVKKEESPKTSFTFDKTNKFTCELITIEGAVYCNLYATQNFIVIKSKKNFDFIPRTKNIFSSLEYINKKKYIILSLASLKTIIIRRYLYNSQACEIFVKNHKSYFINFFETKKLTQFLSLIRFGDKPEIIENARAKFVSLKLIEKWRQNKLSTFSLLSQINKYASRSFNDLNQYPIFPWLFCSTTGNELRDFSLAFSLQSKEKQKVNKGLISEYIRLKDPDFENIYSKIEYLQNYPHLNVHYSISAFIYFYMVRIEPITECHIIFQSGAFDAPSRMFNSIQETKQVLQKFNDNRELVPEFFYLPEIFYNVNLCSLGKKRDTLLNDVLLPKEFHNALEYIYFIRKSLDENPEINQNIHKWVNWVFGRDQIFIPSEKEKLNFFQWQSYEDIVREKFQSDLKLGKKEDIGVDITFMLSFGQSPSVLLTSPMEERKVNAKKNYLTYENINEKITSDSSEESIFNYMIQFNHIKIKKNSFALIDYSTGKYIIVVTYDNLLIMYSKKKFEEITRVFLGESFTFITKQCMISFEGFGTKNHQSSIIICANFTDKKLKKFQNQQKTISFETDEVISCLCKCDEDSFFAGSIMGNITKWKIESPNEIRKQPQFLMAHSMSKINSMAYSESLSALISLAEDNRICIHDSVTSELINVITLPSRIPFDDLYLSKYNTIYAFSSKKRLVTSYTVNGMKNDYHEGFLRNRVFMLDGGTRCFKVTSRWLCEMNPLRLNNVINQWETYFESNNSTVFYVDYDDEMKCIDFWMSKEDFNSLAYIKRLYLKGGDGVRKGQNPEEEDEHEPKGIFGYLSMALANSLN